MHQEAQKSVICRLGIELDRAYLTRKLPCLALGLRDDFRAGCTPTGKVGVVPAGDVDDRRGGTRGLIRHKGSLRPQHVMKSVRPKPARVNQALGFPLEAGRDEGTLIVGSPASDRVAEPEARPLEREEAGDGPRTSDLRDDDVVSDGCDGRRELGTEEGARKRRVLQLK